MTTVSTTVTTTVSSTGGAPATGTSSSTVSQTTSGTVSANSTGPANNATNGVPTYLINQAKAEGGAVTAYGLYDAPAWTAAGAPVATFQSLYPWAKVNYLSLASGDMENKMLAELKAGAVQSDVSANNDAPSISDFAAGMYVPFCNPLEATAGYPSSLLAGLLPNNSSANCVFHPGSVNYAAFAYNTNLVTAAQAATFTNWSNITNPLWKGVIAVDKPTRLSTFGGILNLIREENNMTGTQWVNYMNQFKADQPILTAGLGDVFTDLSSGQASVGISTTDDLLLGVKSGVPVNYKWINPIPVLTTFWKISNGAPHPAMAKLWIYFMSSYAGQLSEGKAGRIPMLPGAAQAGILQGIQVPVPSTYSFVPNPDDNSLSNSTAIIKLYASIFGS